MRIKMVAAALAVIVAGCAEPTPGSTTLRLGYLPNLTHAPAMAGSALISKAAGQVDLRPFNAGPSVVEALFSNAIDAAYVGTNPAVNAYAKSRGEAIRIIAGSTSGGAFLVVHPSISSPADLKGTRLSSPQLGNTQDVALRAWLRTNGLKTDLQGGGDVSVVPQENAQTLETFRAGTIKGAWVPEPWASRLVTEAGGKILVDERDLWPGGRFTTTQLIVRTEYLRTHPDRVKGLLRGHIDAVDLVNGNPGDAQIQTNETIEDVTGKKIPDELITRSWSSLTFTLDPIADSLRKMAADAVLVGLSEPTDLSHIYDLEPLNALLREAGRPEVKS